MGQMDQNPYLFVVGCPRSGTTLLQRMLDHHPQLAVANDAHFIIRAIEAIIPQAIEAVNGGANPLLASDLVEWVLGYPSFKRFGLSEATVREAADKSNTYSDFVSTLFLEYGRLHGKSLAGEKAPDYVLRLPLMHGLFPRAKVIHLIRDGRDVALSTLEWARDDRGPKRLELWRQEPVAVCALWWQWRVVRGRQDGARLAPSQYCEVHYEELIARPEETLRKLSAFLSLPFAREMLSYHIGKTRFDSGLSSKKAWLPPTPGLRDWRTQMAERHVELFEAIAGEALSTLGYERAFNLISREIAAVAERCQIWWNSEMARRQAKFSARTRAAQHERPKNNSTVAGEVR
jgi:hypothetical protein